MDNVGLENSGMSLATPLVPPFVTSSADFERLFESAPISLWLEYYSALKTLFADSRTRGVQDFKDT